MESLQPYYKYINDVLTTLVFKEFSLKTFPSTRSPLVVDLKSWVWPHWPVFTSSWLKHQITRFLRHKGCNFKLPEADWTEGRVWTEQWSSLLNSSLSQLVWFQLCTNRTSWFRTQLTQNAPRRCGSGLSFTSRPQIFIKPEGNYKVCAGFILLYILCLKSTN